jgi:hypothetical protein
MQKRMGTQQRGERRHVGAWHWTCPALVLAVAAMLFTACPAQASFHLIKVREVFPGTIAHPDSDYVELQMYAAGQSLVQFGELKVLGPTGTVTSNFKPGSSVANSANQSTVLIANAEYSDQFPGVAADFVDEGLSLNPAGGAVCWPQTEPPFDDCASWGNFSGQESLPSPGDSAPAAPAGIPDGKALLRSITPGCATFLENADDTNDSAVDFSLQTPNPRNNTTTPIEKECPALPNTTIVTKPANPTKGTAASFTYTATPATGAEFECRLDAASFSTCSANGVTYPGPLAEKSHSFEVRAVNSTGTDPTPATYTWIVDTTPPEAEIETHPEDPSAGNSAAFTYSSSESGSTFQCSLEPAGEAAAFASCPSSGKTYPDAQHPAPFVDGEWTFEVRATDKAGNQSTPAKFGWEVDNSLGDETPPETRIISKPLDPSDSSTASFTYESNEAGSSFECKLDGGVFTACPVTGITYTDLGSGPHSFQVRAIDPSNNVDPTPAGYSFEIVLPQPPFVASGPAPTLNPKPDTKIFGKPGARTRDRTPTFRFSSNRTGATFECKLDEKPFIPCRSPLTTRKLSYGPHSLRVRATVGGDVDPSPARFAFEVVKRRK